MAASSQASLLLQKQLKDLSKNPVDGFSAGLVDDNNIFEWSVTIIGPPDTLYDGGYFNAIMSFPDNYPNSPPSVRFTSEMWHPNVYPDGRVCISILHAPGEDPTGYELASERWTPVHTVESIVLSIISMLSSPNDESPANVEAAAFKLNRNGNWKRLESIGDTAIFVGTNQSMSLTASDFPDTLRPNSIYFAESLKMANNPRDGRPMYTGVFGLEDERRIGIFDLDGEDERELYWPHQAPHVWFTPITTP